MAKRTRRKSVAPANKAEANARNLKKLNARLKKLATELDLNEEVKKRLEKDTDGVTLTTITERKSGKEYSKISGLDALTDEEIGKKLDSINKLIPTLSELKKKALKEVRAEATPGSKVVVNDPITQELIKKHARENWKFNDDWQAAGKEYYEYSELLGKLKESNTIWKEAHEILRKAGQERREGTLSAAKAKEALKKANEAVRKELEKLKKTTSALKKGDDWV